MASAAFISSSFLPNKPLTIPHQDQQLMLFKNSTQIGKVPKKPVSFKVRAARLPAGVELPKVEPKFRAPFLGFTRTAETWNSRACMIGIIGVFILEFILNKGILQVIGVEVGKGLDLPL
nr:light-harvesting chlorophyll a/b-binding protein [Hevea brasiliensis]